MPCEGQSVLAALCMLFNGSLFVGGAVGWMEFDMKMRKKEIKSNEW